MADAAGLREFLRVAVTAPFLSRWCYPEASCLRASPRDGAHPDNQGSRREILAAAGVHQAEADGQFGVRGLRCGPAVWGCRGRVDGAGALAEGAWGVGKRWPPSELCSFGQDWGCFFLCGISADLRLARPQSGGSSIRQCYAVLELVLLWFKCPARSFRGANVSASEATHFSSSSDT